MDRRSQMFRFAPWIIIAVSIAGALALGSCGGDSSEDADAAVVPTSDTPAAELRSKLNTVLAEHAMLAASATGAALGGRSSEFDAAAAALEANSVELAGIVGTAYGANAEALFLEGWRKHIGFFVDYTNGAATKDEAAKQQAVENLRKYARDVAALFESANGLPAATVAGIVDEHVDTLTKVIDAQAAGDLTSAYALLRESVAHMRTLADPLAAATVAKFPEAFAAAESD